jgi:hypothetical protein
MTGAATLSASSSFGDTMRVASNADVAQMARALAS